MHSQKNFSSRKILAAALDAGLPYRRILQTCFLFFLGALCQGAVLFGVSRPFPLSLMAAAGDVPSLLATFCGMLIGSFAGGGRAGWSSLAAGAALVCARLVTMRLLCTAGEKGARDDRRTGGRTLHHFMERLRAANRFQVENLRLRMAFGATAAMIAGSVSAFVGGGSSVSSLLAVFFTAAAAPCITLAFCTLTERRLARSGARAAGMLTLLFAVTRALRDAAGVPFSMAAGFAFGAAVLCARPADARRMDGYRILYGAAVGLVCGLAADPAGMPVYGAAALAAGVLYRFGCAGAIFGGWVTAVALTFAGGGLPAAAKIVPEITVMASILLPLCRFGVIPAPGRAAVAISERSRSEAAESLMVESERAAMGLSRMNALSESMESLSKMMTRVSEKVRRPPVRALKSMCDGAMMRRCHGCEHESLCWEREYASTTETLSRMTAELHRSGRVSASVIPAGLSGRCVSMSDILDEINDECARLSEEARLHDRSDVVAGDLSGFANLLRGAAQDTEAIGTPDGAGADRLRRAFAEADCQTEGVSVYGTRRRQIVMRDMDLNRVHLGGAELAQTAGEALGGRFSEPEYRIDGESVTMMMHALPRFRTTVGVSSRAAGEDDAPRREKLLNGDAAISFTTEDGRMYLLVCDGMGSGGEASLTSQMAAAFLEEMLCAGAEMKATLSMLNHLLRCRGVESSAGLDLMELDLYTGEARFVKSGAAPSFVVRRGRLFRLSSKTAPIGILRALDAEMIRFTPEAGDVIVMVSDGVTGTADETAWLCDLLSSKTAMQGDPTEIARRIVRAAAAGEEKRDDISAAVLVVEAA